MPRIRLSARARRRGIVAVLLALVITGLLGVAAIALDGGLVQDNRRQVQAAADTAALAAGGQMFANYPAIVNSNYTTADPGGAAAAAAQAAATANGYPNNGSTSTVKIYIPPQSGPFSGQIGYAEIIITYYQPRYFSAIWGSVKIPITARAVARGRWAGSGDGIIVLDPVAQDAFNAGGTGALNVTGGAKVIVDSNNASAARDTGGGSATASQFNITGGANGAFNGTVVTGTPPIPDPLAYLPPPPEPPPGTMTKKNIPGGGTAYTLTPGTYTNLPNFTNGDTVTFEQASAGNNGIYYISGGFVSNGANLVMDPTTSGGMMIYNAPSGSSQSGGISIAGSANGTVNLSALTDGPYAGILLWQNRTSSQTISITGNGNFSMTGTFYAANAQMSVTGNGAAAIGSQYISRTVTFGGGGTTTINYSDKGTARVRDIRLVE
jgi:hypothetical protein